MPWVLFLLLIIIAVIFLLSLSFFSFSDPPVTTDSDITPPNYPTMHARCKKDNLSSSYPCDGALCVTQCGGDLVCDETCNRCKKMLGGSCSSNVDCETGLICHSWTCVPPSNITSSNNTLPSPINPSSEKHIRWNEKDEIFPIPPRNKSS